MEQCSRCYAKVAKLRPHKQLEQYHLARNAVCDRCFSELTENMEQDRRSEGYPPLGHYRVNANVGRNDDCGEGRKER